jgi:hypothetical protein
VQGLLPYTPPFLAMIVSIILSRMRALLEVWLFMARPPTAEERIPYPQTSEPWGIRPRDFSLTRLYWRSETTCKARMAYTRITNRWLELERRG